MELKREIQRAFSRAAPRYDRFASLQRHVADRLLTLLPEAMSEADGLMTFPTGWMADLGSGTGYCGEALERRFPQNRLLFLDLAEAMVRQTGGVVGDIERLPLQSERFGLVISNLALQWCFDVDRAFREVWRILRPEGIFTFSTFIEGTLYELRAAWARVDNHTYVNNFLSYKEIKKHQKAGGWQGKLFRERRQLRYDSVGELLSELKGIGARNISPNRRRGLLSPKKLGRMFHAYEELCQGEIIASFETVYGIWRKPSR